jgi:hypothetical protein
MIQKPPTIDIIHAHFVIHVEIELSDLLIPIRVEENTGDRVFTIETADEEVG